MSTFHLSVYLFRKITCVGCPHLSYPSWMIRKKGSIDWYVQQDINNLPSLAGGQVFNHTSAKAKAAPSQFPHPSQKEFETH